MPRSVLALLAIVTACTTVAATGSMQAGPLTVVLDNGHSAECEAVTPLCIASISGESPSDTRIDASQSIDYFGVAFDRDVVNDAIDRELLPGREITIRPSSYRAENPVYTLLIENVGEVRGPGPLSRYGVYFEDDHAGYFAYGPSSRGPDLTFQDREVEIEYGEDVEDRVVSRHEIGPGVFSAEASTDDALSPVTSACADKNYEPCSSTVEPLKRAQSDATPEVATGFYFVSAEGALDPEALGQDGKGSIGNRTVTAPIERHTVALPDRALPGVPRANPVAPEAPPAFDPWEPTPAAAPRPEPVPRDVQVASVAPVAPPPPGAPAVVYAAAFAVAVLLASLYSRIRGKEELLSGVRAQMLALVGARGPLPTVVIARELGRDPSTIEYHARKLERERLASLRTVHGRRVLFAAGQHTDQAPTRPTSRERLLSLIESRGGRIALDDLRQIAHEIPVRTRNDTLRQLRREGVLVAIADASGMRLEIASRGGARSEVSVS